MKPKIDYNFKIASNVNFLYLSKDTYLGYKEKLSKKEKQLLEAKLLWKSKDISDNKLAIGFALFLSDNVYENMYQDIDKDGKTWVSFLHDGYDNHPTAQRFTIQELLEIYKKTL